MDHHHRDDAELQVQVDALRDRMTVNRADIDSLQSRADASEVRSDESEAQAGRDRLRIDELEVRGAVDRALLEELQADGLVDREQVANLEAALRTSRTIGAALGIVMANLHVSEGDAFRLLSKASQDANRKLRVVADDIVTTGDVSELRGA